jgi:hypothetical protein
MYQVMEDALGWIDERRMGKYHDIYVGDLFNLTIRRSRVKDCYFQGKSVVSGQVMRDDAVMTVSCL